MQRISATAGQGLRAAVVLGLWVSVAALAQEAPRVEPESAPAVRIQLGGTLQPRVSYGFTSGSEADEERFGFGLRRARVRVTATFRSRFGARYDVDAASGQLRSVDLYAFYEPHERVQLRLGYLAGAQPRAFNPTSHTRIDAVERSAVVERWADGTTGSLGRDLGLDVRYEAGGATLELFLHGGYFDLDPARGNYRESVSDLSATGDGSGTALAVSLYGAYEPTALPGVEVGGFVGYNAARGPHTYAPDTEAGRRHVAYSGHAYWGADPGSQPVRLKLDVLGVRHEAVSERDLDAQHLVGYAVLGAARLVRGAEAFARYERLHPGLGADVDAYATVGLSFSPSARRGLDYRQERLTLAYTGAWPGPESTADQHLVVLQFQAVF